MWTGIQLFTLRNSGLSVAEQISAVGDTSFDAVEFVEWEQQLLRSVTPSTGDLKERLQRADVRGPSVLIDVQPLEYMLDDVLETYRPLGCETYAVGWLHPDCFETETAVAETAARLSELGDRLQERGARLLYHNHAHEFARLEDGRYAYDVLVEQTASSVGFELDTAWAAARGRSPASLIRRLGDRAPIIHLKDVDIDSESAVELGRGDLNVADCIASARETDTEGLVYEFDDPTSPLRSLRHAARSLEESLDSSS